MEQQQYMVQVICLTYNHARYIMDAMNGFCMQETTFPFVCTILDDASTDGEPKIIQQYLSEHFDLNNKDVMRNEETNNFYLTFAQHKTNKNCYFSVLFLKYNHNSIKKAKTPYIKDWYDTKYIAYCEGDDYWIDPLKLQKQVDYMESHSECGLVHAKAKVFNQESLCFQGTCGERNGDFEKILINNPIAALTTCYRASLFQHYQTERNKWKVKGWKMADYPRWIWMSYYSKVHFMEEEVGVYRVLKNSASHGSLESRLLFLANTASIQSFFVELFKLPKEVKEAIDYNCVIESANACMKAHEKRKAFSYIKRLKFKDKKWLLKAIVLDFFKQYYSYVCF